MKFSKAGIQQTVANWVERVVIGLNFCPFAKHEFTSNRIRYAVSEAKDWDSLVEDLVAELQLLRANGTIETTLLIHPEVLQDFYDYNEFLDVANGVLIDHELEGVFQIASFHPNYQFSETLPGDAENYTNKSPYPMLHLIREESLEKAIAQYPGADLIPEANIEKTQALGCEKLQTLLQACFVKNKT